ncbi:hypothetical protein FDP41_010321 [Naegleria fowleri]|uniref:rhomboid protease n=1 Tax=Naegleria fowleri TaxID=5763 RepID=A0A6A5C675_NAEFO|nr:uncharacterized protein FDP41_010321 [Naegleria fowleri]KAF0983256.1 hypothetical protein FDP41_010321 [Naegleria fowleri]
MAEQPNGTTNQSHNNFYKDAFTERYIDELDNTSFTSFELKSQPSIQQRKPVQNYSVEYDTTKDPNLEDPMDLGEGKSKYTADQTQIDGENQKKKKNRMTDRIISFPYWTALTCVAEVTVFVAMCIVGKGIDDPLNNPMIGPKQEIVIQFGAKDNSLIRANGSEFWRFFVFMFIHQSVLILLFNLMWLLTTVRKTEGVWKFPRMAVIYMLSGIGGGLLSSVFSFDQISTGSTSCIVGIISASLAELILNWDVVFNPFKLLLSVIMQLLVFFIIGLLPTVDQFAHIGGFICGFLSGVMLCARKQKPDLEKRWAKFTIIVARAFAAVLLVIYFALFFPIFYGLIPMKCEACYWLDPTWAMYFGDNDE